MELFEQAVVYIANYGTSLDDENKLALFGLCKQAEKGDCKGKMIIRKQAISISDCAKKRIHGLENFFWNEERRC